MLGDRLTRVTLALGKALAALADAVRAIPGSLGAELLRDSADDGSRYVFIERWTTENACTAATDALTKDIMAQVMGRLAVPPKSMTLMAVSGEVGAT